MTIKLNAEGQAKYDLIQDIRLNGCIIPSVCVPSYWQNHSGITKINWDWTTLKFKKENANKIPNDAHGIYSFILSPCVAKHPHATLLLYVGKADKMPLKSEFNRYFSEIRSLKRIPLTEWLYKCQDHVFFSYCRIDDNSKIDYEERKLICALCPPGNSQYEGILNSVMGAFK